MNHKIYNLQGMSVLNIFILFTSTQRYCNIIYNNYSKNTIFILESVKCTKVIKLNK